MSPSSSATHGVAKTPIRSPTPIEHVVWLLIGSALVLVMGSSSRMAQISLASLLALYLMRVIVSAGGARFNSLAVFALASLNFVAIATILTWEIPEFEDNAQYLRFALVPAVLSLWLTLFTYSLFSSHRKKSLGSQGDTNLGQQEGSRSETAEIQHAALLPASLALMVLGLFHRDEFSQDLMNTIGAAALFAAVAISSVWALTSTSKPILRLLLPLSAVLEYALFQYSGYGRLIIVTLLLSVLVVLSWGKVTYLWKTLTLLLLPVVVILSFYSRQIFFRDQYGIESSGIGSYVGALYDGGKIINGIQTGMIQFTHGQSYWAGLVTPIPRSLWADKPVGLGREIVQYVSPQNIDNAIHSSAITSSAEFYYSWGWPWLIAGSIILGALLFMLDRGLVHTFRSLVLGEAKYAKFVLLVMLSCSAADFVWAGFSIVCQRYMPRIALAMFAIYFFQALLSPTLKSLRKNRDRTVAGEVQAQPSASLASTPVRSES